MDIRNVQTMLKAPIGTDPHINSESLRKQGISDNEILNMVSILNSTQPIKDAYKSPRKKVPLNPDMRFGEAMDLLHNYLHAD
jgi:hypothetical protein